MKIFIRLTFLISLTAAFSLNLVAQGNNAKITGTIIDALTAELLSKPFSDYIKASLLEAKETLAGPESISSEWRDFKTVLRLMQCRLLSENPRLSSALAEFQASIGA